MNNEQRLKKLNSQLETVCIAYENMKEAGVDDELLVGWICYKTKLSKKQVNLILNTREDFFDRLSKNLLLDKLEE